MKPPSMNHSDCTEALHAVKRQCSPDDTRCLLSHGVEVEDCPLPLTSCIAAGGSEQVRCVPHPTDGASPDGVRAGDARRADPSGLQLMSDQLPSRCLLCSAS